jgi:hypothetical protein
MDSAHPLSNKEVIVPAPTALDGTELVGDVMAPRGGERGGEAVVLVGRDKQGELGVLKGLGTSLEATDVQGERE